MLLPLQDGLIVTTGFDGECAELADRHYSRRTVGARQFLYSGKKLVLRDAGGLIVFGWMYPDAALRGWKDLRPLQAEGGVGLRWAKATYWESVKRAPWKPPERLKGILWKLANEGGADGKA